MSQRRSYPNSGDFNLDDLFRPEPGQQQGQQQGQPGQPQGQPPVPPGQLAGPPQGHPQPGRPSGQPEYLGDSALPTQAIPAQSGTWGGAPQPGYPGTPPPDPAPATQYLPPYPTGGPPAPGGYPAAGPGYAPPAQAYPHQPEPGYQGYPPAAQDYPGQEYREHPTQETSGGPGGGRGGRSSTKLIVGAVVAGCLAAAVLVAVLMDKDEPTGQEPKATPVATGGAAAGSAGPTPTAGPSTATVSPEVKAQAQALSDLLGTANDSRQAVVSAVGSVQKCEKLPESQQALTAAAGQRRELQTKLAALKTDKLPGGQQLVEQLNAAWQASAGADDEYAAWAGDAQGGCEPRKTDNQHYKNAVQASGTATTAKKQAAGLWNTVAGQTGLPTRTDGDL
ncbi:hypothetical protein [Streptomyces sp. BE303]|uniref:hypothetical protein n=1 Tax=Streptomyces sp. BE303 TaxID=3002528 RepID=UPI002E785CE8|nr:hypothetical protein [Streptomyces sp. BE303]MED7955397.1 hypothetical protein [Streptomyces sp. BE303]